MSGKPDQPGRPRGRKLAEWLTIGVSTALVVLVGAYLVYQIFREEPPFVPVQVHVLLHETRHGEGKYIVPVEVINQGHRTLKNFKVQVSYRSEKGGNETGDIKIDYLGEHARQKVYLYFDQDPAELNIRAVPFEYQLQ